MPSHSRTARIPFRARRGFADGVRTVIASGDCFAMRPEITGERTLPELRVELSLAGRRIELEAVERQDAVRSGRKQGVVGHRDADGAVRPVFRTSAVSRRMPTGCRQRRALALDRDLTFGNLDLADLGSTCR
jgi:hypothetical protein